MFARSIGRRKVVARICAILSLALVSACAPVPIAGTGGQGPRIDPTAPVQVALLVPGGSSDATNDFLAQTLENAARLAISDLEGVQIDLRVYNTGANAEQAANAAVLARSEGAKILLGPVFAEAANAAGLALADSGINILSFSNNPTIAGGNVFILGPTFENTASRLVSYGRSTGIDSYFIVHGNDLQGNIGRDSIATAINRAGATLAGVESYALSQEDIIARASTIAGAVNASGADAIFLTGGVNADLPIVATALPEAGLDPAVVQYIGITRWDVTPQALALPGLQGGLFALPDRNMAANFEARYSQAYGEPPHPLASLAFDGIAAIGALVAQGNADALTRAALTQGQGFQGTSGIFRLLPDGTNERGLAVATIRNNQVVILDAAPRSFGGAGF